MSTRSHQLCRCVRTFWNFFHPPHLPRQTPPWEGASPSLHFPLCRFARGLAQVCARRSPNLHSAPCKLAPRRFQSCAPPTPNLHSEWAIGGFFFSVASSFRPPFGCCRFCQPACIWRRCKKSVSLQGRSTGDFYGFTDGPVTDSPVKGPSAGWAAERKKEKALEKQGL